MHAKDRPDLLSPLLAQFRPSEDEIAGLKKMESVGDVQKFAKAIGDLDRKYKHRSFDRVKGLDKTLINPHAFRWLERQQVGERIPTVAGRVAVPGLLADLIRQNKLACDCVVPFAWVGLTAYSAMSGPDQNDVTRGMLGARRDFSDEYTVSNPGDTAGKGRVPLYGQLNITFEATLPQAGRWCLLMPAGELWIRGHSHVVGHGNSSTSFDAKVWFHYSQLLQAGATIVEVSGADIHYDGTRSEARTKEFQSDLVWEPRYLFFNANAGDRLCLQASIGVNAEANEDGTALGAVDFFGFPANTKSDHDTFVIKA